MCPASITRLRPALDLGLDIPRELGQAAELGRDEEASHEAVEEAEAEADDGDEEEDKPDEVERDEPDGDHAPDRDGGLDSKVGEPESSDLALPEGEGGDVRQDGAVVVLGEPVLVRR